MRYKYCAGHVLLAIWNEWKRIPKKCAIRRQIQYFKLHSQYQHNASVLHLHFIRFVFLLLYYSKDPFIRMLIAHDHSKCLCTEIIYPKVNHFKMLQTKKKDQQLYDQSKIRFVFICEYAYNSHLKSLQRCFYANSPHSLISLFFIHFLTYFMTCLSNNIFVLRNIRKWKNGEAKKRNRTKVNI